MGVVLAWIGILAFCMLSCFLINRCYKLSNGRVNLPEDLVCTFTIIFVLGAVIVGSLSLGFGISSVNRVNNFEAFYNNNAAIYEEAVEALEKGVPQDTSDSLIEGPNFKQIEAYKQTVIDKRDAIIDHNKSLKSHRYWEDSFWFGIFWKDVPESIDYIGVEKE